MFACISIQCFYLEDILLFKFKNYIPNGYFIILAHFPMPNLFKASFKIFTSSSVHPKKHKKTVSWRNLVKECSSKDFYFDYDWFFCFSLQIDWLLVLNYLKNRREKINLIKKLIKFTSKYKILNTNLKYIINQKLLLLFFKELNFGERLLLFFILKLFNFVVVRLKFGSIK